MIYDVTNFKITVYNGSIKLRWNAGIGAATSTDSDYCKVVIQVSTDPSVHDIPNTPPYVVRDLIQRQGSINLVLHNNLSVDTTYRYSLFIYYYDTGYWYGPYYPTPTSGTPVETLPGAFTNSTISHSKLGTNTRVASNSSDVLVWLPQSQSAREVDIERSLMAIKPGHISLNILYERYYVARSTTTQFFTFTFDSDVYAVAAGSMKNAVATIDSSYSGQATILGGS